MGWQEVAVALAVAAAVYFLWRRARPSRRKTVAVVPLKTIQVRKKDAPRVE